MGWLWFVYFDVYLYVYFYVYFYFDDNNYDDIWDISNVFYVFYVFYVSDGVLLHYNCFDGVIVIDYCNYIYCKYCNYIYCN